MSPWSSAMPCRVRGLPGEESWALPSNGWQLGAPIPQIPGRAGNRGGAFLVGFLSILAGQRANFLPLPFRKTHTNTATAYYLYLVRHSSECLCVCMCVCVCVCVCVIVCV
jgi:hypothetical protein